VRQRYTFFVDPEVRDALAALKARDGITESEAIRRALSEFLKARRIAVKPSTKGGAKKRSR
jgi:hypothetical protein